MAKPPEPENFKASEQDVDTEATVTKLAGDDTTLPEWKPRAGRTAAPPVPEAAPVRIRRSQTWFSRLFKSLFG